MVAFRSSLIDDQNKNMKQRIGQLRWCIHHFAVSLPAKQGTDSDTLELV